MECSAKVQRVIDTEGISDGELSAMLAHAAYVTRPDGFNRRFYHWLFKVTDRYLIDMRHLEPVEVGRRSGHSPVQQSHDACDGMGCHGCGWVGYRVVWEQDPQLRQSIARLNRLPLLTKGWR